LNNAVVLLFKFYLISFEAKAQEDDWDICLFCDDPIDVVEECLYCDICCGAGCEVCEPSCGCCGSCCGSCCECDPSLCEEPDQDPDTDPDTVPDPEKIHARKHRN